MKNWVMLMLLCTLLISCNNINNNVVKFDMSEVKMESVSQDYIFTDIGTIEYNSVYSYNEFEEEFSTVFSELRSKYVIYHYKSLDSGSANYTMINTDSGWVILFFDEQLDICGYTRVRNEHITSNDINEITIGTTLGVIKRMDPHADYHFENASWSEYPKFSYHFTEDNWYIFSYDYGSEGYFVRHIEKYSL